MTSPVAAFGKAEVNMFDAPGISIVSHSSPYVLQFPVDVNGGEKNILFTKRIVREGVVILSSLDVAFALFSMISVMSVLKHKLCFVPYVSIRRTSFDTSIADVMYTSV